MSLRELVVLGTASQAPTRERNQNVYLLRWDGEGFLYFAGRTDDRLRVDSENLAAAMIEGILARWEGVAAVAVYAVPDPVAGDQVMVAVCPRAGVAFSPLGFAEFLLSQPDLGTKMAPRFVRVAREMPVTATNKVARAALRREGFRCGDPVWWRPDPGAGAYRRFTPADESALLAQYRAQGREGLLPRASAPEQASPPTRP